MCAALAKPIVRLVRREPELAIAALNRLLRWEICQPIQAVLADEGDTQVYARGQTWCADLALELRRLDGRSSYLAVVAPEGRDEYERDYIWPCYAASLGMRRRGPAGVLALVDDGDEAAWAGQTITSDFGWLTITPQAVTAEQVLALRRALHRRDDEVKLAAGP